MQTQSQRKGDIKRKSKMKCCLLLLNTRTDKLLTYNKDLNTTWTEEIIIPALQRESQSQNATA